MEESTGRDQGRKEALAPVVEPGPMLAFCGPGEMGKPALAAEAL